MSRRPRHTSVLTTVEAKRRSFALSPDEVRSVAAPLELSSAARKILRGALDTAACAFGSPHAFIAEPHGDGTWRPVLASGTFETSPGGALAVESAWLTAISLSSNPISFETCMPVAAAVQSKGRLLGGGLLLPNGRSAALAVYLPFAIQNSYSDAALSAFRFALHSGSAAIAALPTFRDAVRSNGSQSSERDVFAEACAHALKQCWWIVDRRAEGPVEISDGFEHVWGHPVERLGRGLDGFIRIIAPEDRDRALSALHISQGRGFDLRLRAIDSEGEIRWIWLRAFTFENEDRVGFFAEEVTEDMLSSERGRASEARAAGESRLVATSELAGGVAHEINNPLTVIVGVASLLKSAAQQDLLQTADLIRGIDKIDTTARRIAKIVSSLKQLGRRDLELKLENTPIAQAFIEINDVIQERSKALGVRLEIAKIPRQASADLHPTLIGQAFLNLLNNALDAVKDTPDAWVKVDWSEDRDSNYVYVTDSGPGIPIKNRAVIFDPFFTTKGPHNGTGLGLSLAWNIVARHGGVLRLDVLSPNTRFVVQLPKAARRREVA